MAFDVFEGRDGAFSDVAGTDVLESVRFQQVLQGLAVIDDPVSPGRVELVDDVEGRFGDWRPVPFARAGPLDIALVQRIFRVQVQIDQEPEIRGRDADGAGGFQDAVAFFQHIHSLRVIEMLEEVLGIDIVDGIVREREPFPCIQIQGSPLAADDVHIGIQPSRNLVRATADLQLDDRMRVHVSLDLPASPEPGLEDRVRQVVDYGLFADHILLYTAIARSITGAMS